MIDLSRAIPWGLFIGSAFASLFLSYSGGVFVAPCIKKRISKTGRIMPPEIGGAIIFFSLSITFLVLFILYPGTFFGDFRKLFSVVAAATLIFLLGFIDDQRSLHYSIKILSEVIIVSILPLSGFRLDLITNIGGAALYLPVWLGSAVMVGWIIFMMNAVNLIDGLDGLAAGVVAMASFTIFLLGCFDNYFIAAGALALACALLGILPFNTYPAKFYLGDSGSLFIGFLIGVFSLFFHVKTYVALAIFIPLLILFVPIFNTILVIISRLKRGKNPFKGDIFHLHYRLVRQGLSHQSTVLFLWAVTASLCVLVVARQYFPYRPRTILFLSGILIFYTILVQFFLDYLKVRRLSRAKR